MKKVRNQYGVKVIFDVAVSLMDDDLREKTNMELAPCTEQEFFEAYCKAHKEKYGEEFELNKMNPTY